MTPVDDEIGRRFLAPLWSALRGDPALIERIQLTGAVHVLPSVFDVTGFAASTIGVASLAVAELHARRTGGRVPAVRVDRVQAALAFRSEHLVRPVGWTLPAIWDPLAGDYRSSDGWIRLHTNYAHHREAALAVLGCAPSRDAVADAVASWDGDALEAAIVAAGGCAAVERDEHAWRAHPQGRAVAASPLVGWDERPTEPVPLPSSPPRPLAGVRVLDLTRVIAGPVATRFLAAYGAEVLRLDPPGFEEVPALVPDVTAGKRCASLDLRSGAGRVRFEELVAGADVLVVGYRPGALDDLGLDEERLRARNPSLVVGRLDAYGWDGPWAGRRGFDSLVQMSTGITRRGAAAGGADRPVPMPAQALDHGTGYLLAAALVRALTERHERGYAATVRASLARTAGVLLGDRTGGDPDVSLPDETQIAPHLERVDSAWGAMDRMPCPGHVDGLPNRWETAPGPLGGEQPAWGIARTR